jgi:hypothetical protein
MTDSLADEPEWLTDLVVGVWDAGDWQEWHNLAIPALAKRGIKPSMLEPIGIDPDRPMAITVNRPESPWVRGGTIDWSRDDIGRAVLNAIDELIANLDAESAAQADGID